MKTYFLKERLEDDSKVFEAGRQFYEIHNDDIRGPDLEDDDGNVIGECRLIMNKFNGPIEIPNDPIEYDAKTYSWRFWDETWSDSHGPFKTRREAASALHKYCNTVLNGIVTIPIEPTDALLASMAMRLDHSFGLMDEESRKSLMSSMRQLHEEVVGTGFYKPTETK